MLAAVHPARRRFATWMAFGLCGFAAAAAIAFFASDTALYVAPPFLGVSLLMAYLIGRDIPHRAVKLDAASQIVGRVLESMPCAVLLTDENGSIRFANRGAETMFRYTRAQLIGIRIESLIPAKSRGAYDDLRQTSMSCERPAAGIELSAVRGDDSEIMVEIGLAPIDIEGERFMVASITDIGERKRLERDAALQRDELAHLSRTASLSGLSSSLAHELIQPLTAILSNAQAGARFLAHRPCDVEGGRASLESVVDNAKRASDVIRKLRNMLRKGETELVQLEINDVVRDVMQIVRSDLNERRVEVVLDLQEGLPNVRGDRVQLQQVMMNLMMNAADAMDGEDGRQRLTLRTIAVDAGEVEVQVEDTGTGIPHDDLERIFAPFVTTKAGGMGLGLSVCAMLMKAHAGRLWAANNSGGGATLYLRLPPAADAPLSERSAGRCR